MSARWSQWLWFIPPVVVMAAAAFVPIGRPTPMLSRYGRVPAFVLIDQAGRAVSADDLRGRVWIANFMFTRCAGQCPIMSSTVAHLAEELRREPVQFVSFTVDASRDTPEVLARYAAQYGALPAWRFVTGDQDAIRRLSLDGFHMAVADGVDAAEPVTHSVKLVLVDGAGEIRGYYDATDPERLKQLRSDLRALLRRAS